MVTYSKLGHVLEWFKVPIKRNIRHSGYFFGKNAWNDRLSHWQFWKFLCTFKITEWICLKLNAIPLCKFLMQSFQLCSIVVGRKFTQVTSVIKTSVTMLTPCDVRGGGVAILQFRSVWCFSSNKCYENIIKVSGVSSGVLPF